MHRVTHLAMASLLSLALWGAGCGSLSTSSQSISESVNGLSTSISESSQALSRSSDSFDDDETSAQRRHREDVRLATSQHVRSGGEDADLLRELGRIALRHGISDWEDRPETLLGIGSGAREAGLAEAELDALLVRLGQGRSQRALAQKGWLSAGL